MAWEVLEKVELPFLDTERDDDGNVIYTGRVKNPGDKITKAEMDEAQQTAEDIKALVKDKAIKED